jgi:cytochrome c peroxidase
MTPRWHRLLSLGFIAAGAGLAKAQGPPPPPPPLAILQPPPAPAGNPVTTAKALLGKALFWDEQLSSTGTVSCGSCHQANHGGSDPRTVGQPIASRHPGPNGIAGDADDIFASPGVPLHEAWGEYQWDDTFGLQPQVTGRKAPSYIDAGYSTLLFWDGRAGSQFRDPITNAVVLAAGAALESQAAGPPLSTAEMGHLDRDWNDVAAAVELARPLALASDIPAELATFLGERSYPELFQEAFGSDAVTPSRIIMAIATFERTLFSNQTPLDVALAGGAPLTPAENRGRTIFQTRNCLGCHNGQRISDDQFKYIGVRPVDDDLGRFAITGNPADRGAFRTPSLRNVQLRAPYMHNGRFNTLEEVVDFYDRGGDFTAPNKAPAIVPLNLTAQEKSDLVAFLRRPLTDPRVAAQISPFDRPTLYAQTDRVPEIEGAGSPGAGGFVPTPMAIEPPLAGSGEFTVAVSRALGGAQAMLLVDDQDPGMDPNVDAAALFAKRAVTLEGTGAGNGYGSATLELPADAASIGKTFYGRWLVSDPAGRAGFPPRASSASPFSAWPKARPSRAASSSTDERRAGARRVGPGRPTSPAPLALVGWRGGFVVCGRHWIGSVGRGARRGEPLALALPWRFDFRLIERAAVPLNPRSLHGERWPSG